MKSWTLILAVLISPPAWAADSVDILQNIRLRAGSWVGTSVGFGELSMAANDGAQTQIRIDALPTLDLGLEVWPSESVGTYLAGRIGFGADIGTAPDAILAESVSGLRQASVAYNAHQLEGGARVRWLLGPRAAAIGLLWGWGARVRFQSAQDQRPSILLDRLIAGPETSLGVEWPLTRGAWLRFSGRLGAPFLVRESPDDSGRLDSFVQIGTKAEFVVNLTPKWALQAYLDFEQTKLGFVGLGSRGAGNTDVKTETRFLNSGVWARYTAL